MTNRQQNKDAVGKHEEQTRRFASWTSVVFSPPIALTAIVTLAVLLSFVLLFPWLNNGPTLIGIVHVSCVFSLAVLVAIVSAVMRDWKIYLATFLLLLLDGVALATVTSGSKVDLLTVLLPTLIAIPILITLESIQFFLGTFINPKLLDQPFVEGLQFKTKHLFIATAGLAIIIVIAQSLAPYFSARSSRVYAVFAMIVVLLSVNALVSVWAILGRVVGFRLVVSLVTAVSLLIASLQFLSYLGQRVSTDMGFWISFSGLSWLTSSIQLYLFRRQGCRFVRY